MTTRHFFTSLTRISDLPQKAFSVEPLPRDAWNTGDYVVGQVLETPSRPMKIELVCGRMTEVAEEDLIVGALGTRHATLEAVGDWRGIDEDGRMEALTGAGIFGKATSRSFLLPRLISLSYKGHILLDGEKKTMRQYVPPAPNLDFELPVVMIIGTSMSAGKTATAKVLIRQLKRAGLTVIGAKLAGAGRYRDILAMQDAGADHVFDFVDAGLPSTVVPKDVYGEALGNLLARMAAVDADVLVTEVGASPLEPYNGTAAIEALGPHVRCTVLAASDPYAVTGMMQAFAKRPSLVTGLATSTQAGIELVEKLSGVRALNILDPSSFPKIRAVLDQALVPAPREPANR